MQAGANSLRQKEQTARRRRAHAFYCFTALLCIVTKFLKADLSESTGHIRRCMQTR